MLDPITAFKWRLCYLESKAKEGVIPGVQDTYELEQLIGRIKELNKVINWLEENPSTVV